jgi:hypothetical protein
MASTSEEYNDPSSLRIRQPNIECTPEKIAAIQEKLNAKSPGWKVFKSGETGECLYYDTANENNVKSYFPTPKRTCKACAYLGGSRRIRKKRKTKTLKRRK